MSRNRRALVTAALAVIAGLAGVTVAGDYSDSASKRFGPLRPVVVTTEAVPSGTVLDQKRAARSLEVRRIPARFAPAGYFPVDSQVIGLLAKVDLAPGSYLTSALVGPPPVGRRPAGPARTGQVPVEVSVHGIGALPGRGRRVDVLVSAPDPTRSGADTKVVARAAVLLDLSPAAEVGSEPGTGRVTLGIGRRQVIGLVDAEAAGRRITLIPARPG